MNEIEIKIIKNQWNEAYAFYKEEWVWQTFSQVNPKKKRAQIYNIRD